MRRPLLPATLCMAMALMFAPPTLAQSPCPPPNLPGEKTRG